MFPIVINDGQNQMPESDVYYLVGKEGIFIKKKLGIMESLSPVKNISILQSVQATAKMHITKIPAIMTAKVANFFTDVYDEHSAEAVVLLFYNEEHQHYKIIVPPQKVSGAGAEYNRAITVDDYSMIGTIHSHANFTAFHSGTDQGDEQSFDGLHITFGHNQKDPISISASIVANGHRTIVTPEEYLEGVNKVVDIDEIEKIPTARTYKYDQKLKKMVETTSQYQATTFRTYRRYDKRYEITRRNNQKAVTPASWLNKVEKKIYTYNYGAANAWWKDWNRGGYWKDGKYQPPGKENNKWGGNFDSGVWSKNKYRAPGELAKDVQKDAKAKTPPQNVGVKVDPIKFPTHTGATDDGAIITDITPDRPLPCEKCAFKERAFAFIIEQLEKKYESLFEDDDEEQYYCDKCNILVTFEYDDENEIKGEMVCPSCKTDDHLIQLADDDEEDDPPVYHALDDHGEVDDKPFKCLSCQTSVNSVTMLKQDNDGLSCPTCGTLILPNQNVNYKMNGDKMSCDVCTSEFTKDLVKDDECPFCKAPLVENIDSGNSLLGEDAEEINQAAMQEVNNQKNPANMIPQPEKQGVFSFMKNRFLRRE